jgi:hypothetical protein
MIGSVLKRGPTQLLHDDDVVLTPQGIRPGLAERPSKITHLGLKRVQMTNRHQGGVSNEAVVSDLPDRGGPQQARESAPYRAGLPTQTRGENVDGTAPRRGQVGDDASVDLVQERWDPCCEPLSQYEAGTGDREKIWDPEGPRDLAIDDESRGAATERPRDLQGIPP